MESRKMILMNLVVGQQWQCRQREQTYGHRQGPGGQRGESGMDVYTLTYVNRQPMGICCMTQGTQTGAL